MVVVVVDGRGGVAWLKLLESLFSPQCMPGSLTKSKTRAKKKKKRTRKRRSTNRLKRKLDK